MANRRDILKALGVAATAGALPTIAFGRAATERRFVLVILRGALDGLALAPPYGDGAYRGARGELALAAPGSDDGVLKLDGLFGLHPSLGKLHARYMDGEALLVHAVASPYRERSHFDGQDLLESGGAADGLRDGWLNRALTPLGGRLGDEQAIALAQNTPLVLRGTNSVTSWAPSGMPDADDSTLERLADLYAGDEFFSMRLAQALKSQDIAGGMDAGSRRRGNEAARFRSLMSSASRFLAADDGPRIAVLEFGGWDTHANQGAAEGQLANRFAALDDGIDALANGLGDAWRTTLVAVVTEFGRTVEVNGTRGTDHGTATAAVLAGGAVDGGRVIADWPGLRPADRYQGRDLMPTTDLRSVFKGVLVEHLALDDAFVDRAVFPDSGGASALQGLVVS